MKKRCGIRKRCEIIVLLVVMIIAVALNFGGKSKRVKSAGKDVTTITLTSGQVYDFSEHNDYKTYGSYYVDINSGGTYTLKGEAKNTMLRIDAPATETVVVYLQDIHLAPDDTAPGISSHRPAMQIGDSGGTVILYSQSDKRWPDGNYGSVFLGQGHRPAIEKNNKTTRLEFTSDVQNTGIITAKADPEGFRTCGIGCYSLNIAGLSTLFSYETGNIYFKRGKIIAWGSQSFTDGLIFDDYDGGPGIGANGYGSVDGLYFEGGEIFAVAGDTGSAAIGTASGVSIVGVPYPTLGSEANNIVISGGKITTKHYRNLGKPNVTYSRGGASIGGGYRTDVHGLVITGGEIDITTDSTWPNKPDVGIGAGEEGDAEVKITGGTIRIDAAKVGIGAYATAETDYSIIIPDPIPSPGLDGSPLPDDSGNAAEESVEQSEIEDSIIGGSSSIWFGEAKVDILGGNITIDSDSVCIGGTKPDSNKGYVEIDGGTLNLHSHSYGPAIGPWSVSQVQGKLHRITIRGGTINAHVDNNGDRYAVIGCPYYTSISDRNFRNSFVDYIEFTGGTVRVTQGDYDNPVIGRIGGNKGDDAYSKAYSKVVINGGNVYAALLDNESSRPVNSLDKNAVPVYLQKIRLKGGDTWAGTEANVTDRVFDLKDKNGAEYLYGTMDVKTFPEEDAQLWFWMPADAETGCIEVDKKLYSDLNATKYYGILRDSGNGDVFDFYPEIQLNLRLGTSPSDRDGSANVHYGAKALTGFQPADDSASLKLIDYYQSEQAGGIQVLDRYGAYIIGNDHTFIDQKGRWIYVGKHDDVSFSSDVFKQGKDLYAVEGEFTLGIQYESNLPDQTESTISGVFPSPKEYNNSDTVVIAKGSTFSLQGYTFKEWNTSADGSGTPYQSEQQVPAGEFRKSKSDPSEITLYAQWEPIRYKVIYESGIAGVNPVEITYTYDRVGKVAGAEEVSAFGEDVCRRLGCWIWTDGNQKENKYYPHSDIKNFVDFSETTGTPTERRMTAVLLEEGKTYVVITRDSEGESGLADDIILNEMVSQTETIEHRNCFEEASGTMGCYCIREDAQLNNGIACYVTVDHRTVDQTTCSFTYSKGETRKGEISFFTTTLDGKSNTSSLTITDENGNPFTDKEGNVLYDDNGRPYALTLQDQKIIIDAEVKADTGYHISGWTYRGAEPEWNPTGKNVELIVKGTSILSPELEGNQYTVIFDPDESFPTGETPTGTMEPQVFTIGVDQNLTKSAFKKKGYIQDSNGKAWNTYPAASPIGGGEQFTDGELIPADHPISYTKDTVTLYAAWRPCSYTVRYTDPSADPHPDETEEAYYDQSFNLKDDWKKDGYILAGWSDGTEVYRPGKQMCNLCTVRDDGSLEGTTLSAVWVREGSINVNLWLDTLPAAGKAPDIRIKDADGFEYQNIFTEDSAGYYVYDANTSAVQLENGTYYISIDGYQISNGGWSSPFQYDKTKNSSFNYEFYTNSVQGDDGIASVKLCAYDGVEKDQIIMVPGLTVFLRVTMKGGYSFEEWTWEGTSKPLWLDGTGQREYTSAKTMELTAHSSGAAYTVTFDANDSRYPDASPATGQMEDQKMAFGIDQNLNQNQYARTGYYFVGWSKEKDGSGTCYGDRQMVKNLAASGGETVTLYAQWNPFTYDIAFRDPEHRCLPQSLSAQYNEVITLPDADDPNWNPGGITLRGWKRDPLGKIYQPGEKVKNIFTMKQDGSFSDVLLYAEWTEHGSISLYAALDDSGIVLNPADIVLKQGTAEFSGCFVQDTETPGLYVFKADEPTAGIPGSGKLPAGEYLLTIRNHEQYGIPEIAETFTYDPNLASNVNLRFCTVSVAEDDGISKAFLLDSSTGEEKNSVIIRKGAVIAIQAETEDGWHFVGWSNTGDEMPIWEKGSTAACQNITILGTTELTAHAGRNVYTVVFDANDRTYPDTEAASGSMQDQDMVYGEPQKLFENIFSRKGYVFTGWNTKPDGSGIAFEDMESVMNLAQNNGVKIMLYAGWEPREYRISFVDDAYGRYAETITVKYDEKVKLIENDNPNWKPDGHLLSGWLVSATGVLYQPGSEVKNICTVNPDGSLSDVTLSAIWDDQTLCTVNIEKKTGIGKAVLIDPVTGEEKSSVVIRKGTKLRIKAEASAGWHFTGWSYSGNEPVWEAEKDMAEQSITVTGNVLLTAGAERNVHTISFDLNGGRLDGKTGTVTLSVNEGDTITLPLPSREGYTFDYWEGSRYNAGDQYTVTEAHAFRAVWKMNTDKDEDKDKGKGDKSGPKTGDDFKPTLWYFMLVLGMAGMIGTILLRKKIRY